MKRLLLAAPGLLLLCACQNPYTSAYISTASPELVSGLAAPSGTPEVVVVAQSRLVAEMKKCERSGYAVIGYSIFESETADYASFLGAEARRVQADLVLSSAASATKEVEEMTHLSLNTNIRQNITVDTDLSKIALTEKSTITKSRYGAIFFRRRSVTPGGEAEPSGIVLKAVQPPMPGLASKPFPSRFEEEIAQALGSPARQRDSAADAEAMAAAAREQAILMERFMVSESRAAETTWRYATAAGFEILTHASSSDTRSFLAALQRGIAIEDRVLPRDWLPDSAVPDAIVIDDTNLNEVPSDSTNSETIVLRSPDDAMAWGPLGRSVEVWNARFGAHDEDTYTINSNIFGVDMDSTMCMTDGLERIFRCAPPLPVWLIEGLAGRKYGIFRESFILATGTRWDLSRLIASGPGTLWVSLEETQRLLKVIEGDKDARLTVPPLERLFAEAPPPEEERALWISEAALFARWGLFGPGRDDPAMSRAFLDLVRRARREPITEDVFRECFGFGYSAMEERLGSFLKKVLAQPTQVELSHLPVVQEPELTDATADQTGRILGDWMRMEGNLLRDGNSALCLEFLDSAGQMLERAYRRDNGLPLRAAAPRMGERPASASPGVKKGEVVVMEPFVVSASRIHDPRLLSVYGLYEHDTGNDARALELLEAAARQRAARPSAYVALAEIRYAQAMAKPLGTGQRLSARQAASVLDPLETALQFAPSPVPYRLIVDTWENCEARPSSRDINRIVEGVETYPRYAYLAYHSALVCARSGYGVEAQKMLGDGERFAAKKQTRESFERLRSSLGLPAASASR
jgi:hypothetical protein